VKSEVQSAENAKCKVHKACFATCNTEQPAFDNPKEQTETETEMAPIFEIRRHNDNDFCQIAFQSAKV
jgi:hypothetical protein